MNEGLDDGLPLGDDAAEGRAVGLHPRGLRRGARLHAGARREELRLIAGAGLRRHGHRRDRAGEASAPVAAAGVGSCRSRRMRRRRRQDQGGDLLRRHAHAPRRIHRWRFYTGVMGSAIPTRLRARSRRRKPAPPRRMPPRIRQYDRMKDHRPPTRWFRARRSPDGCVHASADGKGRELDPPRRSPCFNVLPFASSP